MKARFPAIIIILAGCVAAQTNVWHGIIPLQSTRTDVEKLLGKPVKEVRNWVTDYDTGLEKVSVKYSTQKCGGGWDVPLGTVLEIGTHPPVKSIDDLKLDETKLFLSVDDAFFGTWTDPERGVQYGFDAGLQKTLYGIRYIPRRSDNNRRCDGFPPYRPEGHHSTTLNEHAFYNPKHPNFTLSSIDVWMADIRHQWPDYIGYAVIYFDNKRPYRMYRSLFERANKHILWRKESPEKYRLIDGGMREENWIKFYALPKDWASPSPEPTIPSPQFMKKKTDHRR